MKEWTAWTRCYWTSQMPSAPCGLIRPWLHLAALRKHLPELVRWFTIQHESRILLVHAAFGGVGYCETGLLQGDPLSMLVLAITLLDPLKRIQALLRADCS